MTQQRAMDWPHRDSPGITSSGGIERYRDRTALETVSDGYLSVVQVSALNAVTQVGMESLRQCDIKRCDVLAEHPTLEVPLTGLLFNHARLVAEVQNSVTRDWKRG